MDPSVEISVVIPTWRRPASLRQMLEKILACNPRPQEILVHIDAGDAETSPMLEREFQNQVTWFQSQTTQGPGGGRNLLFERAKNPLVASFDDDSWPLDADYFQKSKEFFHNHLDSAVLTGQTILRGQSAKGPRYDWKPVACFENCSCVIRRQAFLATGGFIPLRYAYGMEEADVALRLLDQGWQIYKSPHLRIFHDTGLEHHTSPQVNAAHITNTALLAYLRYPKAYWPLGAAQVLNRVVYSLRVGRYRGILRGLLAIPSVCHRYSANRRTIAPQTLTRSRKLRQ